MCSSDLDPEFEPEASGVEPENQEFMVNTMNDTDMMGFGDDDGSGLTDMFSDEGEEGEAGNMPEDELESMARDLAKEIGDLGIGNENESENVKDSKEELDQVLTEEEESEKGKKGKKKKKDPDEKKPGFFKRLSLALFGEDEEEAEEAGSGIGDIDDVSDENMAALRELEGKKGKKEKDDKALKAQKKKEKKAQKDQKKAEKKQAKAEKKAQKEREKQAKPKKEKKPKVVEKSKPLPKKPVFMIMLVGASLVVLIYLVTTQVRTDLSQSKMYRQKGRSP